MFTLASKASLILLCFLLNTVTTNAQTGVLDVTFGNKGKVITSLNDSGSVANAVAIQADRKIVVVGSSNRHFGIVRYNTNGIPDSTFGGTGKVSTV
jgi:uncharacterized delta-60 repeat protein